MTTRYRNGDATITEDAGVARIIGMADVVEMQAALRRYLADKRGFDLAPSTGRKIPRTLNADVLQLAAFWSRAIAGARKDVFGVTGAQRRWQAQAARIATLTASADPRAVYADNAGFWNTTSRVALRLQVAAEQPPELTFSDALAKSIHALPETLSDAAAWVFHAAGDLAHGIGEAAGDVAEGAGDAAARGLGPLVKPLLVGAGLLGGAYLVAQHVAPRKAGRHG
ncbi:MAG: hypothetical protein H6806_11030 [Planctomycetes bacterium]|nr:hypothetical protein [Planctomycetota bacterium]